MRTDLHHQVHAEFRQRPYAGRKRHRLPCMTPPVGPVQSLAGVHHPAGQVADHRQGGGLDGHAVQKRFQRVQRRLHQGAVERLGRVEPPDPDPLRLEALRDGFDASHRSADHLVGPVVRGDVDADSGRCLVRRLHHGRHARRRGKDRGHGARLDARQQCAACCRQPHPVVQAEHARRLGRRQLADAVPQDRRGPDAHARPEGGQRCFQGIERRLLPRRIAQFSLPSRPAEHHVQQGGPPLLPEHDFATVENRPRNRLVVVERPAHADPLTPLSGIDEGHFARRGRPGVPARFGQRLQPLAQRAGIVEDDTGAAIEVAPPHTRGPGHVRQRRPRGRSFGGQRLRRLIEPRQVPRRKLPERARRLARERQETGPPGTQALLRPRQVRRRSRQRNRHGPGGTRNRVFLSGRPLRGAVLLHHDVGVGPGYPEGVHAREPWPVGTARPVHHGRSNAQGQTVPVETGVGILEMQVLRKDAPIDRERRLDQSGNPGRRLQMADVGLHRSHQKRPVGVASPAVDVGHGVDLDGIAHRGAGPVGLQIIHLRRWYARLRQRRFNDLHQRGRVRHGQTGAGAAVIHRGPPDHRPDPVAVRLGLAQPLQHHHPAALAPHVAVGGGIERLALSVGGQHHRVRPQLVDAAVEDGLDPAGDGQVRLPLLEVRHRVVHRHQG